MAQSLGHGRREGQAQRGQPDHGVDREAARLFGHGLGQGLHHVHGRLVGDQRRHAALGLAGHAAQRQDKIAAVAQPRGIAVLIGRRDRLREFTGVDDALPVAGGGLEVGQRSGCFSCGGAHTNHPARPAPGLTALH
ncbi:hypothetical protein D3C78_1347880 [compost metagenome]